jgi:hypothetical protein
MSGFDAFYQQLDSERLLDEHGPRLRDEARAILAQVPDAKVAGMILTPDSREAEPMRQAIAAATGQAVPPGLLVGTCPRAVIEDGLRQHMGTEHWLEESWQRQRVLPVVVCTRDGMRFGFFGLDDAT